MKELNQKITVLGHEIFRLIGENRPSVFNKSGLYGRIMEWAFTHTEFKNSLFRLVDVLPALNDSASIRRHTREYLTPAIKELNPFFQLAFAIGTSKYFPAAVLAWALRKGVSNMASQFIAGNSPAKAEKEISALLSQGLSCTCDLLGEFALSNKESEAYLERYLRAIKEFNAFSQNWLPDWQPFTNHPGSWHKVNLSVKLSALYSQASMLNFHESVRILNERLAQIMRAAQASQAGLYIDAEDAAFNPVIYECFKQTVSLPEFADFPVPGIVIQSYLVNSEETLRDLLTFARKIKKRIAIRLVKGAYYDHEKVSALYQQLPIPVWPDKAATDRNYEKLSRIMLENNDACYSAFASHNIRSLSQAAVYAEEKGLTKNDFELQMLYGMATPIALAYRQLGYFVRLYVPLGELIPLMGYLVRRLLENTSNESFLRHTFHETADIEQLLSPP